MSPERVRLRRAPSGARAVGGDLAAAERAIRAREDERRRAEGRREAAEASAATIDGAVAAIERLREQAPDEIARTAVELAVEIARHLLHGEIEAGRYDLERIVREALAATGVAHGTLRVHVSPGDARSLADVRFRRGVEIVEDPGVSPAEVRVETPQGLLVRELDLLLDAVREALHEERRR